jgi:hypothetical protein
MAVTQDKFEGFFRPDYDTTGGVPPMLSTISTR